MPSSEMPIFTRTFDFLVWLLPVSNHFPKAHRFTVTSRLLDAASSFSEYIEEANIRRGPARQERLARADEALAKVRYYLRLARRWEWLSAGQYEHVDSYANRLNKGTHRALARCQQWARRYPYVLQCDVRQFFPSLDHAVLRATLWRKVADPGVRWLIDQILAGGAPVLRDEYRMVYFPGDDLLAALRPRGLPIGNLTSQFWANCYLNPFDHFIKQGLRCHAYLRFVDDFLLFADDRETLWNWKAALEARLAQLRLVIHAGAGPRPVAEGIPFLGFVVFPDRRRLKRRKGIYYQRRFRRLLAAYARREIAFSQLDASLQGWINHVRFGNTIGLRRAMLKRLRIPAPGRGSHG